MYNEVLVGNSKRMREFSFRKYYWKKKEIVG